MPKVRKKRIARSSFTDILNLIVLLIVGAFMALPLVYAISNAFKPLDELFLFPPRFFVRKPTLNSFNDLFVLMSYSWVPFTRYFFNTIFITVVGITGQVILASMAAYVLAKHKFPGRNLFFMVVVTSLMFAPQVTAIPNYIMMSLIGFLDTYSSIIIPAWGYSLGLFLMKQFIEQMVPDSLVESARCDGSSEMRTIFTIVMPIVKPAWLTLIIFTIQSLWNTTGSIFIYTEQLKPLPYALSQILQGGIARAGVSAAGSVLMMSVPITVFIITQSNIVETMSTSGIKE